MKFQQFSFTFLIILSFVFFSCDDNEKMHTSNSFKIIGNVKNIPDSAVVILKNNNIVLDSALIIKGEFESKGSLKEPGSAILKVPSTGDYKAFWIENSEITFSAEKNKFKSAKITGSKTQVKWDMLLVKEALIINKLDSLENLLKSEKLNSRRTLIKTELNQLQHSLKQEHISYIQNNPASYVSAAILNDYKIPWAKRMYNHSIML